MTTQDAKDMRTGYRKVGVLLFVGFASIGFTRLEDRAIIGAPGGPASGVAALAVAQSSEPEEDYTRAPDDSVSLGNVSRAPANRIRRALQSRDIANVASRLIEAPPGQLTDSVGGIQGEPSTVAGPVQELASIVSAPATFTSLAPTLPGQGSPVFAASAPTDGGSSGGGTGGGTGTGGGGVTPTPTPTPTPASPVPEPGSWLMIIMGLFAVGGAMRSRNLRPERPMLAKLN